MSTYQEFRHYSISRGGDAVRISVPDRDGQEYFAIIDAGYGKDYRERRDRALDRIEDAMARRAEPGEVVI
jgi:hypothetical protein